MKLKTPMTAADVLFITVCAIGVTGAVFVEHNQVGYALAVGAAFWIVEFVLIALAFSL